MAVINILKKFNRIFSAQQRAKTCILAIMMVIGAGLEMLGVSLILPLISIIMEPAILRENEIAVWAGEILHIETEREYVIVLIVSLMAVFILKNGYLYFQCYAQTRFVNNNRFMTQKRLLEIYLNRPYEFFLETNLAEINRVLTSDIISAFGLLTTMLNFFTEAVVAVFLVILIVVIDPIMAVLISAILILLMVFIGKILKPILQRAGREFQECSAMSGKWLNQAVHGIKDLKVSNKETFFIEEYTKYGRRAIDAEKKNQLYSSIPRLLIEALSVSGMLLVILVLYIGGRELDSMLPQLSAFAMAALRLLPSANRMSACINMMPYQEAGLDKLIENLFLIDTWEHNITHSKLDTEETKLTLHRSCMLSDITYHYHNADNMVLEHADMEIPVGKSVGIVGTSGAGKTTAVDVLLGLLKPQEGCVLSDGMNIERNYEKWLSYLSYVPQSIYLLDDSIRANVAFGVPENQIDDVKIWKALDDAMLSEYIRTLPDGLDTRLGEHGVRFSGGQRQRIGIARALYGNPELLIFDEATSALDNETETDIMNSINHLHGKKTLVIIAHRLGTIEACDLVYRVQDGKIIRER